VRSELDEIVARRPAADFVVELDPAHVADYHEHGFTWVERITSDEEIAWLREVYDHLFGTRAQAVPGGYFDLARPYESEGEDRLPQILVPERAVPALQETAFWRNGRAIAATLLGVEEKRLFGWGHMIRKPARIGAPLPWHQDEAYWDPGADYRALGSWMPLDPATLESGCLHFLPGSQRGPVRKHRHVGDDPKVHALVTDDADPAPAVAVPLAPGGASFHHCRTLHSSGPNTSARVRRAWANEWQLPPARREVPLERPWVDEGRRAWESRRIAGPDATARRGPER
jgi:ectoine hydroxylase-related dioxygenase (phytanoyl-CoA dioxygenase family)